MSVKKGDRCYWQGVLVEIVALHTAIIVRLLGDYSDSKGQRLAAGSEINVGRNPQDLGQLAEIKRTDPDLTFIEADPSMTLRQWRLFIQRLSFDYGESAVLYTDADHNNVQLIVKR